MNKVNPNTIAKWFCGQGIVENADSIDGNIKVQKLLFFSQLIYMAKHNGNTMFDENFNAFEKGVVLESVRKNYKKNYEKEFKNIQTEKLNIEAEILEVLNITKEIFGDASAQELSELSHEFDVWNKFYKKSKKFGKHITSLSVIPYEELKKELYRIEKVLKGYELSNKYDSSEDEDY